MALSDLRNLSKLSVSGNHLPSLLFLASIPSGRLSMIDACDNPVTCLNASHVFAPFKQLEFVFLSETSLSENCFYFGSANNTNEFPSLRKLFMQDCQFAVYPVIFGAPNLVRVKLASNAIEEFPSETSLIRTPSLWLLGLNQNHITHIPSTLSWPVFPKLQTLNLNNNEKFQFISPEAFVAFPNLEELDLDENEQLGRLPNISYMAQTLRDLRMSRCGIRHVTEEELRGLIKIKLLDLSHNFITHFPSQALTEMPRLQELKLKGNLLHSFENLRLLYPLPDDALVINLKKNPLVCDWRLCWMIFHNDTRVTLQLDETPCSQPSTCSSLTWTSATATSLGCFGKRTVKCVWIKAFWSILTHFVFIKVLIVE